MSIFGGKKQAVHTSLVDSANKILDAAEAVENTLERITGEKADSISLEPFCGNTPLRSVAERLAAIGDHLADVVKKHHSELFGE